MTTRLIVAYVRRRLGDDGVRRLCALAGETRPVAVLEDETAWSSYRAKIALFEAAEQLTGDPWVARRIGEALLGEQIGAPLRVVIGALGSPQQVLRSCARANVKFSTNSTMRCLEAGPGRAVVTYRVDAGYAPSRHDCRYTQGILTQASALFGLLPATVLHPSCQVDGADECVYEVTWPRWTWLGRWFGRRGDRRDRTEVVALRERVVDLERTVADLVSSRDLDEVLHRIAARASAAVRAQRFLLAVRVDEQVDRVIGEGFEPDVGRRIGAELLAGRSGGVDGAEHLVAEVASAQRRYGWLAAFLPAGTGFLPVEPEHFDAYARLAAAALDAATALERARRRETMHEALVALGHRLARQHDEEAIAREVATAMPAVLAADGAAVLRWEDRAAGTPRPIGTAGVGAADEDLGHVLGRLPALLGDVRQGQAGLVTAAEQVGVAEAGFAAVAAAALRAREDDQGVVLAGWRDEPPPPRREELVLALSSLADQAGTAIANVRLLARIRHEATHDRLTGLAGRTLFNDRVEQALAARRRDGGRLAVCFLDLDRFKAVNDRLGHAAGDDLLQIVAERIRDGVRASDTVARMSGDEFAVLLRDVDDAGAVAGVVEKLVASVRRPIRVRGGVAEIGASIGVAMAPGDGDTAEGLLRAADAAMYVAKRAGGGHRFATERAAGPAVSR